MKLNRRNLIDLIMIYLFWFVAASGLIDIYFVWHVLIVGLFALLYFCLPKKKKINKVSVYLSSMIVLFFLSVVYSRDFSALSYNIRSSLYSLCVIGIIYIINKYDKNYLCKKLFDNIKLLNALLIINIVVLVLQIRRTGFLIKSSWLAINPYYEDHCAGLFGFNATNVLGVFSIFVMMLNLSYAHAYKRHRSGIIIYTIIVQAVMAFLSQYNDNTGFYMLIAIFLGVYAYSTIKQNKSIAMKALNVLRYVLIVAALFIIALQMPVLGDYIRNSVVDKIQRVLFYESFGGASGGSERLAIIRYAFKVDTTYRLGTGVGSTQWIQANSFGFLHFGINSMGSYLLIGGLWFFVVYTLFYAEIYYSLLSLKSNRNLIMKIIIVVIVVIFTLYTTIFNDARTSLMVGLIAAVIKPLVSSPKECILNMNENKGL